MAVTTISWTNYSFNPWWGCSKVSPACRFCYARDWDNRYGGNHWGVRAERRLFGDQHWREPLKWNRDAEKAGVPARVFCASMGDVFEDHPQLGEPRQRLWNLIDQTPWLRWLLLTKRPENVAGMVPWGQAWPQTVWLGVSAETQRFAEERLPILTSLPAAVRFVSAAPLLGDLDLTRWLWEDCPTECTSPGHERANHRAPSGAINWIITEGESGAKARPSHPDWFRNVRDQSVDADVRYHHKQNGQIAPVDDSPQPRDFWLTPAGERLPWHPDDGYVRVGGGNFRHPGNRCVLMRRHASVKTAGRLLDGQLWDGIADDPIRQAVAA